MNNNFCNNKYLKCLINYINKLIKQKLKSKKDLLNKNIRIKHLHF